MRNVLKMTIASAVALGNVGATAHAAERDQPQSSETISRSFPPYFLEHQKYFKSAVYRIGKTSIWSINNADGYSANSILIEGDDGLILVDTGVSREHGKAILKEIRKISQKPIVAIFYSHHHADHYNGTDALVAPEAVASGQVKIFAWENFESELASEFGATGPIQATRVLYQTGLLLGPEEKQYISCCGLRFGGSPGYIAPTHALDHDQALVIAGIDIQVFYTGGEAKSEFSLYLPQFKTILVGDELYQAAPNMYTVRGSKFRETSGYLRAYDRLLRIDNVEHMGGSHLIPVSGRDRVREVVIKYRDLVQYTHDQAVRFINKGEDAVDLQNRFREVPSYLDIEPFTREVYGTMEHNAPAQFTGYLGWFSGDPTELSPTPKAQAAERMVKLIGGRDTVFAAARSALEGDPQWAAELATILIRMNHQDLEARTLKANAFRQLGYAEINSTWRGFYLTGALELEGKLDLPAMGRKVGALLAQDAARVPLREAFEVWRYRVAAEKAGDRNLQVAFDVGGEENITLELRNSILLVHEGISANSDAVVKAARKDLTPILRGDVSWADALKQKSFSIVSGVAEFQEFLSYFDEDVYADRMVVR